MVYDCFLRQKVFVLCQNQKNQKEKNVTEGDITYDETATFGDNNNLASYSYCEGREELV